MKSFTTVTAKVVPLPMKDVDTDLIIPAQFLTSVSKDGYGENLFRRLRDNNPDFPFNQPRYKDAQILVADSNFGCGSSREHAVWALTSAGISVVIAKSFADIFYNNSSKNGLLLVVLDTEVVDKILALAEKQDFKITVDLAGQSVKLPDGELHSFKYDPFRKHCMLNGLDDIQYIKSHGEEIANFRSAQESHRFMYTGDKAR